MTTRISRTDIARRRKCEMLRFLARHWGGKGIQAKQRALPLIVGQILHQALASLWLHPERPVGELIREAVEAQADDLSSAVVSECATLKAQNWTLQEQIWLIASLVHLWAIQRLPVLRQDYTMVSVEEETELRLTPRVSIPLRMDAILKRVSDGVLFILDYKSTSWAGEGWADEHRESLQTVVYTYALGEITQQPIGGMIYEPLVKGKREQMSSGPWQEWKIQNSPLCYHWKGPTGERVWKWTNRKGFTKVANWEEFASVEEFLTALPQEIAATVVGTTLASMPDATTAAQQLQTMAFREEDFLTRVAAVDEAVDKPEAMRVLFEQNHDACRSWGGRQCEFYQLCHSNYGLEDPLSTEMFEPRVDHHQVEEL